MAAFKATFFILTIVAGAWLIAISAVLFSLDAFDTGDNKTKTVADGSVYIAAFLLVLALNVAVIGPGLLLLQPLRLWRLLRSQKRATTPRQQFRGAWIYHYDCDAFSDILLHIQPHIHALTTPHSQLAPVSWASSLPPPSLFSSH